MSLSQPSFRTSKKRKKEKEREATLLEIPGKILGTLQRKLWDSNALVTGKAVSTRDTLANVYLEGKQWTGMATSVAADRTLALYRFVRESSTTGELPAPLVPVRNYILLPTFRGVERTVEFVISDKLGETYRAAKDCVRSLPLGSTVVLPVDLAEGVARYCFSIIQAPLPSAERVAYTAEIGMDVSKRAIRRACKEVTSYFDLIDVQLTRTLTHAQWDILGYGPYAELPPQRRAEVVDRMCDRYLSIGSSLGRRYELLALIRWNNPALHDDLVGTGVLAQRSREVRMAAVGGPTAANGDALALAMSGEEWLDADAPWRRGAFHYQHGVVVDDVPEDKVLWFWRRSAPSAEMRANMPWILFQRRVDGSIDSSNSSCDNSSRIGDECVRLERAFRSHLKRVSEEKRSGGWTSDDGDLAEGTKRTKTVTYKPMADSTLDVVCYSAAEDDVPVDQGRRVVSLHDMRMRPVYWCYSGGGDHVRRAVWLRGGGSGKSLLPFSPAAAAVLEDAFLYLRWKLGCEGEARGKAANVGRSAVLLTIQVQDQLVQFRSLTDIVSITRTLLGAVSVIGRRSVYRGYPASKTVKPQQHVPPVDEVGPNPLPPLPPIHKPNPVTKVVKEIANSAAETVTEAVTDHVPPLLGGENRAGSTENVGGVEVVDADADLRQHVSHLILVVHGIGDALSTMDLGIVQLKSLVDCCDNMRAQHREVVGASPALQELHEKARQKNAAGADGAGGSRSPNDAQGRVEYLPVEWHSRFKSRLHGEDGGDGGGGEQVGGTRDKGLSIWDITLKRAATLRAYTNDTVLDILYFISPKYHQIIVEEVTNEINRVLDLFEKNTVSFSGRVSIAAHSLGAIICFDVLANQPTNNNTQQGMSAGATPPETGGASSLAYYGGSTRFLPLRRPVENLFCLGSPIGMFLMVRGQHRSLGKDFKLAGAKRVYNIFHPFDPVAFRLEPLLKARGTGGSMEDSWLEPEILPTWQGGLRVQYQVKRWWHDALSSMWRFKREVENGLEEALEKIGLIGDAEDELGLDSMWRADRVATDADSDTTVGERGEHEHTSESDSEDGCRSRMNTECDAPYGPRVDFALQEKEIEVTNEYIFALGAHVIYWTSKDLSLFMATQIMMHDTDAS